MSGGELKSSDQYYKRWVIKERDQGNKALKHWEVCNCQPEARSFPEESGTCKGENTFYWWVRTGRLEASASTGTWEVIQVWNATEAPEVFWWNSFVVKCDICCVHCELIQPAANTWLKPCSTTDAEVRYQQLTCPFSEQAYFQVKEIKSLKMSSQSKPAWPPSPEKNSSCQSHLALVWARFHFSNNLMVCSCK